MDTRAPVVTGVIEIGRCIGCDQRARLDAGVCRGCLDHPKRGRRWAEMAHRVRAEPEFAAAVYFRIATERGRMLFLRMFGAGCLQPRGPEGLGGDGR